MKKRVRLILLVLSTVLLLVPLCGCKRHEEFYLDCHIGMPSYDNETVKTLDSEDKRIIVRDKKYVYNGKHIILLRFFNETEKLRNVGLLIKYYDGEGNLIKNETKYTMRIATGEERYDICTPGIEFESYDYTVIAEDSAYLNTEDKVTLKWNGLITTEAPLASDRNKYHPVIMGRVIEYNGTDSEVSLSYTCIIFDSEGEIYTIAVTGAQRIAAHSYGSGYMPDFYVYRSEENKLTWPKELENGISVVLIPHER